MAWRPRLPSKLVAFLQNSTNIVRPKPYSLGFLNAAQFFGSLNDNIFKLIIMFFLIEVQGTARASIILSSAGAVYVLPFLLFSSAAGILADRFSKQKLLVSMKVIEIVLMLLAMLCFWVKSIWGSYTILFLLSMHSATFGPSKYGIIPELVPKDSISRANGWVTSFTYLAIILGTFLASFLTDITNRNFVMVAGCCLLIAILGFFSTLGIHATTPRGTTRRITPFFIREIYQTLVMCKEKRHLLVSISGSSFFLFLGAFTQLNIIPFAIQSLGFSEVAGGYLFLSTALGIAVGAMIAGRALKKRVELGLSCLSAYFISAFFFTIALFSHYLTPTVVSLIFIGIFGGAFIVPFDSYTQTTSPDEKRGQVIAATNFLSFTGVLLASFALYFFSNIVGVSSAAGFGYMGIITFVAAIIFMARLSDYSFPFFARKIFYRLLRVRIENEKLLDEYSSKVIVIKNATGWKAFLLTGAVPSHMLLVPESHKGLLRIFHKFFYSVRFVPGKEKTQDLFQEAKKFIGEDGIPCLLVKDDYTAPPSSMLDFLKIRSTQIIFVTVEKVAKERVISFTT